MATATATHPPGADGRSGRRRVHRPYDQLRLGLAARVWGYTANGWVDRYRDHDGGDYKFEHRSWNHRTAVCDPLGRTIRYEYTATEKIAAITDPAGNRHEYGYDLKGGLTTVDHAGERVESYLRDHAGRVVEKRDAAGQRLIAYEYGADNLKSRQRLSSGEDYRYKYTPGGRFAEIRDGRELYEFAYASGGRRRSDLRGGRGICHRFLGGELAETTILDRFTIRYERTDEEKDKVTIIDPTGGRHLFEYGVDGSVYRHFACGQTEASYFNSLGRCLGKHLFPADPEAAVWRRRFEYSAEGDLVSADDSELGATLYSYDAAHQLVGVFRAEGPAEAYAYDIAGNLTQAPHLNDVAIGRGNRLLIANGDRFSYDGRNNLCTWERGDRTLHFVRDSLDRLREIEGLDRPWTADYDPLGRRIRKTYGTDTTEYFWDTDFLTAERHADGRLRIFVRVDDFSLVPWLVLDYLLEDAEPTDGRVHTVLSDQRGAPIAALDGTGKRVWSASYSPYGLAETRGDLALPQRLAGQHCDPETGLYYHRFRYYSPELGRFLEEDPAGIGGGLGLYNYTSNPLVGFDPRGLKCKECGSDEHETEDCPKTKKPIGDMPAPEGGEFSVPQSVSSKFPESWGAGKPNKKGVGTRWLDPENPAGSGVRVDQGSPGSPNPSQRVDHVVVRSEGKVIGRNGEPIPGSIADYPTDAHIPLSEYSGWSTWNSP